jgi:glycerol dehydrogenase
MRAAERKTPDADLEALVEATVLLSALGFENGGLSVSHAMTRGLQMAPTTASALHGDHVAYGLLVQLALEDRPEPLIEDLRRFYREVGLPCRLADLGMNEPSEADLRALAEKAMLSDNISRFPRPVDAARLEAAIRRIEG